MSVGDRVAISLEVQIGQAVTTLQSLMTSLKGIQSQLTQVKTTAAGGLVSGNPLSGLTNAIGTTNTQVTTLGGKLKNMGGILAQNATSFGTATASIWGAYNAYDNLVKVELRAESASNRVRTMQATLTSLQLRHTEALQKGNLSSSEMALLEERITNTKMKLTTAQQRELDLQGDVNEAWAGFASQIGPQVIAAGGSIIQLTSTLNASFAKSGGLIATFKNAIISLIPGMAAAKAQSLLLGQNIGNLGPTSIKTTGILGKFKAGLGDLASTLNSSKGALLGMAGALGLAAIAAMELFSIIEKGNKIKIGNELILSGKATLEDLQQQLADLKSFRAEWGTQVEDFIFGGPIGKLIKPQTAGKIADELITGVENEIKVKEGGKIIQTMLNSLKAVGTVPIPVDFAIMTPERQADIKKQMEKIIAIINNPNNWRAKIDPNTGKEIFSAESVRQFSLNVLNPLMDGLQKTVQSGAFDAFIQKATDGLQKKIFTAMSGANALTGETGKFAVAAVSKSFNLSGFEPGSQTEASFKKAQANIKATTAAVIEYKARLADAANTLGIAADQTREYDTENFKLAKTFGALTGETLKNTEVRTKLLAIQDEHDNGYKKEELDILDLAAANNVYSAELANLASQEGDHVNQMNEILAASINYTSAIDDTTQNQKLLSLGFRDGVIQAKDFFDNLVKNTEQEGVFNAAIADGAESLGINADLMAFSSSTAQELITTIYQTSQAYFAQAYAAAQGSRWVNDLTLKTKLLDAASLSGLRTANDWTIAMIQSVEATQSEHDQLLHLAADMLQVPISMATTSEQAKTMMQVFTETGSSAAALASVVNEQLVSSFEHLKGLFDATKMKDFKNALKDLSISKDLKGDIKDLGKSMVDLAKNRKSAQDTFDVLLQFGDEILKKHPKDWAKFVGDLGEKLAKGAGKKGLTVDMQSFITQVKRMSPTELQAHSKSIQMFIDAFQPSSSGGKKVDAGEWVAILEQFNKEGKDISPSVDPGTTSTKKLGEAFAAMGLTGVDARAQVDMVTGAIDVLKAHFDEVHPVVQIDITVATGLITRLIGNFNGWVKAAITPNPVAKLDITTAVKAITRLINDFKGWIKTVEQANPKVKMNIEGALNQMDTIVKRMQDIGKMTATATITVRHIDTFETKKLRFGGSFVTGFQHGGSFIANTHQNFKGAEIAEFNKPELVTVTPLTDPNNISDRTIKITTQHVDQLKKQRSEGPTHIYIDSPIYLYPNGEMVGRMQRKYVLDSVGKYPNVQ